MARGFHDERVAVPSTFRAIARDGLLAGAAGTVALNFCAYADMALTRRPPSDVPRCAARALAERLGFALEPESDERGRNRWEGYGEMLGLVHGLAAGAAYGTVRATLLPGPPWVVGALALALETLLAGEGAATALGVTDPRRWGMSGTVRGIVLRVAFGLVTARTFDALQRRR